MNEIASGRPLRRGNQRFLLGLALLTLSAWLLREYFIAVTVVEIPIRGDVREYFAYAWNLVYQGTFSHAWPGSGAPVPDTYRGPGYPVFLAICMWLDPRNWYEIALHAQAALGALTATMTVLLARHWLSRAWALVAGAMVAVWPHHVAATGALLTEVVFGFLLILALLLAAESLKRRNLAWAAASGVAFSAAAMTSLVSLLFPIFVALVLWRARLRRAAALILVLSVLGSTMWSLRGLTVEQPVGHASRMAMNLVQGSWPQYHPAFTDRRTSSIANAIDRAINEEIERLAANPHAGITHMAERMARNPMYYVNWYVLKKPYLLWAWEIRIGAGDVYFQRVTNSPLETQRTLRIVKTGLKRANPAIFALSAFASLTLVTSWLLRRKQTENAAALVAAFCIYVTLVHLVFQAEPRYSIPYRPMQMMMLVTALAWLANRVLRRVQPRPANL